MFNFALAKKVDSSTSEVDVSTTFWATPSCNLFLTAEGAKDWSPEHLFSFLTLHPLFYSIFFV